MGEHALGRDAPALADVAAEVQRRRDLRFGIIRQAAGMAGIGDLDADRAGVDVGLAGPVADAGMPGAALLRHQLQRVAVLEDEIMRRRPARPGCRAIAALRPPPACRCSAGSACRGGGRCDPSGMACARHGWAMGRSWPQSGCRARSGSVMVLAIPARSGRGCEQAALALDHVPGGVDRRQPARRDGDRLFGQAAGDLAVGMGLGDEAAIELLQRWRRPCRARRRARDRDRPAGGRGGPRCARNRPRRCRRSRRRRADRRARPRGSRRRRRRSGTGRPARPRAGPARR